MIFIMTILKIHSYSLKESHMVKNKRMTKFNFNEVHVHTTRKSLYSQLCARGLF